MSKDAIETLRQTIRDSYCLRKSGSDWVLEEHQRRGKQKVLLRAAGNDSFGFSADPNRHPPRPNRCPPFAFFSSEPPPNITLMCDAFVAVCRENEVFWFIIEMKTTPADREYQKQMANGKILCDWLTALLKEHGHIKNKPRYLGLLIEPPRKMPSKGTTSHQRTGPTPFISKSPEQPFDIYKESNNPDIDLLAFISQK